MAYKSVCCNAFNQFGDETQFEIGRKELSLLETNVGFFRRGRTMACFCAAGRTPVWNEQLHREEMTGASVSLSSAATSEEGLTGSFLKASWKIGYRLPSH